VNDAERDRRGWRRVAAGDPGALAEFYDRYADLLYSLALRIVGSAADAEAVSQDAWLRAWRAARSYDPARDAVGAWLAGITRACSLDRLRASGSRPGDEAPVAVEGASEAPARPTDPATGFARRALRNSVAAAITALAPEQRQALELAYFEGRSPAEIAARLNAPLGAVKSWMRQGLSKLRERVPVDALP
jgi:RNA polymerase sigma-70 factor (ECF subfamily)